LEQGVGPAGDMPFDALKEFLAQCFGGVGVQPGEAGVDGGPVATQSGAQDRLA
jgi:hypothetical protein